jgi:methylated-DNA-protein-cysteine methyltransferase-like protein
VTARATPISPSYRKIYAVVARIPRGKVATYGQVAALAGLPRQARLVGYALNVLSGESPLPWHRVVNARGQVSPRGNGLGFEQIQAQLLKKEGVRFPGGGIRLADHQWRPRVR